jgi:poly-gamma-glutamate synthesis protein (capsule biosynthesis protein)
VARACEAVADTKRRADLVIVAIHWGVSFGWLPLNQSELCTYEQPLGRALIDAGADAVIGHHPHVLHGIETYCKRPIFYSVGNFLFHRHSSSRGRGSYPPYDERGEPEPPTREQAEFALAMVERLSAKFGTPLRRTETGIRIEL